MYLLRGSIIILFIASHFCCYNASQGRARDEKNTSERPEQKAEEQKDSPAPYVEGQVLVKFKEGGSPDKLASILPGAEVEVVDHFPEIGAYCIEIKGAGTVPEIIEKLEDSPLIEYAEPNYLQFPAQTTSDDSTRSSQQELQNTVRLTSEARKGEKNAENAP